MRTITTREQLLINGRVHERIATHIVTGAHGYETLCTNGYNVRYNKAQQLVESCEKIAEVNYLLPVLSVSPYGRMYTDSPTLTLTHNRGKVILLIPAIRRS